MIACCFTLLVIALPSGDVGAYISSYAYSVHPRKKMRSFFFQYFYLDIYDCLVHHIYEAIFLHLPFYVNFILFIYYALRFLQPMAI